MPTRTAVQPPRLDAGRSADYSGPRLIVRPPNPDDGLWLWRLARDTGVLDVNSPYSYLLWCRDFTETSVVVLAGDEPCGFLTGFRRPLEPDTLFVWQVAVASRYRGRRAGRIMLDEVWRRAADVGCRFVEASVTPDNVASTGLFESFARDHGAAVCRPVLFSAGQFPVDHEAETLFRIGPMCSPTPGGPAR